jgi:uncharacterized membrane protein YhaH (DUF805 family)
MNWYLKVLKNYAGFEGRARRTEYWMFVLFSFIFSVVLAIIDGVAGTIALQLLYTLAVLIPSIAVAIRRLHDQDKSGWLLLLLFIPILGWLALLILYCLPGTSGDNKYGPDPLIEASP